MQLSVVKAVIVQREIILALPKGLRKGRFISLCAGEAIRGWGSILFHHRLLGGFA